MSYSTVSNTYHIWLCSIATDKVLVDKQEEIELLREKTTSLTLQLTEKEKKISQLMEKMKGKESINYYLTVCNIIRSEVSNSRCQCLGQIC